MKVPERVTLAYVGDLMVVQV